MSGEIVLISKEVEFDSGHRVMTHQSKCRNVHGHRYKVQAEIAGPVDMNEQSPTYGMVTDFTTLKDIMTELIHDPLDHGMIIWKGDRNLLYAMQASYHDPDGPIEEPWKVFIFPYMPTAENIARWCWDVLVERFIKDNVPWTLNMISVWETPTSVARFIG
jgi:6-pyruvoyltetrahydropterin/6-carboxytetrahydropterin synthase